MEFPLTHKTLTTDENQLILYLYNKYIDDCDCLECNLDRYVVGVFDWQLGNELVNAKLRGEAIQGLNQKGLIRLDGKGMSLTVKGFDLAMEQQEYQDNSKGLFFVVFVVVFIGCLVL